MLIKRGVLAGDRFHSQSGQAEGLSQLVTKISLAGTSHRMERLSG
jgi:hypothetical protein